MTILNELIAELNAVKEEVADMQKMIAENRRIMGECGAAFGELTLTIMQLKALMMRESHDIH